MTHFLRSIDHLLPTNKIHQFSFLPLPSSDSALICGENCFLLAWRVFGPCCPHCNENPTWAQQASSLGALRVLSV
jgi:hypothetical protein